MNRLPEHVLEYIGVNVDQYIKLFEVGDREVFGLSVSRGQDPFALWHQLYDLRRTYHHWPLILGNADVEALRNVIAFHTQDQINETIRNGLGLNLNLWFGDRAKEIIENIIDPKRSQEIMFSSLNNPRTFANLDEVTIALIPRSKGWDIPAILGLDGFYMKPDPYVEVALFKRWEERLGAEVIALYGGTLSLLIRKPPLTRSSSIHIGVELFLYFPDKLPIYHLERDAFFQNLIGAHSWEFNWGYP